MAQDSSLAQNFMKWRSLGMIMCLVMWLSLFAVRVFLSVMLPPILMYPIMGVVALALVSKFFAFISHHDEHHVLIMPAISLMTFIIILTGSVVWLGLAATLTLSGITHYLVKLGHANRQYNRYIAYGLFAFVFAAIVISVFCFVTNGAILPTYVAMLFVNLFAVCFYFLNHPNIFEHYKQIPAFVVLSMDFFALSILFHTSYIPMCLFFPSMFTMSIISSFTYMFHAISLTLMTIFIMRPSSEGKETAINNEESDSLLSKDVPVATVVNEVPSISPYQAFVEPILQVLDANSTENRKASATPSAPPAP